MDKAIAAAGQRQRSGPADTINRRLLVTAMIGWALVSMDVAFFSYTYPLIQKSLGISTDDVAVIYGTIFGLGAVASFAVGPVVDRFGRRPVFQLTLLATAVGSALTAAATSLAALLVFRSVSEVGSATESIAGQSLVAEDAPRNFRAVALGIVQSGYALGFFIATALCLTLDTVIGWRAIFLIGLVPALFVLWIRRAVPESKRFSDVRRLRQEARGHAHSEAAAERVDTAYEVDKAAAVRHPLRQLMGRDIRRTTIVIFFFTAVYIYGTASVQFWLPELTGPRHFTLSQVQLLESVGTAAAVFGYLLSAWLGSRWGSREVTILYALLGIVAGYLFAFQTSALVPSIVAYCFFEFFTLGISSTIVAFTIDSFPTRIRGTGMGLSLTGTWIGWIAAGTSGPALFSALGVTRTFEIWMVLFGILGAVILCFARRVTPRAELESIAV